MGRKMSWLGNIQRFHVCFVQDYKCPHRNTLRLVGLIMKKKLGIKAILILFSFSVARPIAILKY